MVDTSPGVLKTSGDVFGSEIRKLIEDLAAAQTMSQQVENVDDANPKASNTGSAAALGGIDGDAIGDLGHDLILSWRPREYHGPAVR